MARRPQTQDAINTDIHPHPYMEFESHPAWKVLDEGITNLLENHDLEEKTSRSYVVGYLLRHLFDAKLLKNVERTSLVS